MQARNLHSTAPATTRPAPSAEAGPAADAMSSRAPAPASRSAAAGDHAAAHRSGDDTDGSAGSAPGTAAAATAAATPSRSQRSPRRSSRAPLARLLRRLRPTSLLARIVLTNILGLLILVGGILYFNQSRESLIDARVESLMTQARIMAAAIASAATVDTGEIIIDPDRLLAEVDENAEQPPGELSWIIRPEQVAPVLRRITQSTGTIARVYDPDGILVADSRNLYGALLEQELPELPAQRPGPWERFWRWLDEKLFSNDYPRQKDYGYDNGKSFPEVRAALTGASVSVVRVNDAGEIIVTVGVPVSRQHSVLGALLLSTRGGEIDEVLRSERRLIIFMFLIAGLVTLLLSVSLASQIAEPIRKLAAAAEKVRKGVDNRVEIPDFSDRDDEIGHLSGALRDMTRALYDRIDAIESFAADVAHEIKNPLTSLRSAVETLQFARTKEQRERLIAVVTQDVKRLDRLISDISDASRLDAELARSHAEPVDVAELAETLAQVMNETAREDEARIVIVRKPLPRGVAAADAFVVMGHDVRLAQVLRNLLANARSFSPPGGIIRIVLQRSRHHVEMHVEDEGPGIPPENLDRIFQRFYTHRPASHFGQNSGLGLAISRQIVEAHGGRIWAENIIRRSDGEEQVRGARFVVRLPARRPAG